MIHSRIPGALAPILALSLSCGAMATASAADFKGNIPADRLTGGTYRSPDGTFTLALPELAAPGAKAEERSNGDAALGVFFADDFGTVYYVLRTDNSLPKHDLDKIAEGYVLSDALREKKIVSTDRGPELRLAGLVPGSSPLVQETTVKRKTVQKKMDLHEAISIFLAGRYVFEVAAGVTATHGEPDADAFRLARQNLEVFLAGLDIEATAPP